MASISHDGNGYRRIQFILGGERKTVRLGKVSAKAAETVKSRVEAIIEAKTLGRSLDRETASWLRDIDDGLYAKLANNGLVPQRYSAQQSMLGPFIDDQIAKRKAKPATKEIWRQGKLGLIEFFGADKPLAEITPGMADDYREFLKLKPTKTNKSKTLATMTVRKRLQFAKMIFRAAARHKLIDSNPFEDVGIKATKTAGRERFITKDETDKLLDACGSNQDWRTIIVLSRWGGLRCPSEVLSQKIADIDWENDRITVTCPKLEHHEGMETRVIPFFPELKDELLRACEAAPDGAVYVVDEKYRKAALGPSGWRNVNLRTPFEKIVKRAGLEPWPRLFHNLRSSRQTELEERFPTHVVCAWLGNSPEIAREHYLQVTDEHWRRAAHSPAGSQTPPVKDDRENPNKTAISPGQQGGPQSGAVSGGQCPTPAGQNRENPDKNATLPIQYDTKSGWGGIRDYAEFLEENAKSQGAHCRMRCRFGADYHRLAVAANANPQGGFGTD